MLKVVVQMPLELANSSSSGGVESQYSSWTLTRGRVGEVGSGAELEGISADLKGC